MTKTTQIHSFHIPVMGLAYTIDTPLKVAKYGISSAISITEDTLIEKMREHYYKVAGQTYHAIKAKESDCRARRITDYLNLVQKLVGQQFENLKQSAFEKGSEIVRYFELLPEESQLKALYNKMMSVDDARQKQSLQELLREKIAPGSIDVNIMTKIDGNKYDEDNNEIAFGSEALAALRGYANSELTNSSVIFSAGMNPRLYSYITEFDDFFKFENGSFKKKITLKVSDYRSALIQGKFLAKRGIWVSEFRIESGLNCGGHAFATDGVLIGPILEEFKTKRDQLVNELFDIYSQSIDETKQLAIQDPPNLRITFQGGIGCHEEDQFLREYYNLDGTGWGSPFLLVPEATTVDEKTLEKLCHAGEDDIILSNNSPLGVKFHYLKGHTGEKEKLERFEKNRPGSPCTEKKLAFNTEFSEKPLCVASRSYLKSKFDQLFSTNLMKDELKQQSEELVNKECLCIGLSNSALIKHEAGRIPGNSLAVTICPGPNLAYFRKIFTLKEMIDHIYGKINAVIDENRPQVFIKEMKLYINYLQEQLQDKLDHYDAKRIKYVQKYCQNMSEGINYYKSILNNIVSSSDAKKNQILEELKHAETQIQAFMNYFSVQA